MAAFSFQKTRYDENPRRVDLRPISDKEFERWQVVEYYGGIESISAQAFLQPEVHQRFVGGDWEARPAFLINAGLGFDLGGRGPGIVLKSRFEWHWGRKAKQS